MQPRSLQQVLSELDTVYNPQIESVRKRQALIPGQIKSEEAGLQAKQTQAFDDILGGARRRGLGFSGIPLGEQARYTSTEYLPTLARLRQSGREQAMSLEDAILGIQERRGTQAQGIYQAEQDRALAARQAAAQQASLRSLFNTPPPASKPATPKVDAYANVNKGNANNAIHALLNSGNLGLIQKTIAAITKSAQAGNLYDKYKLELLDAVTRGDNNAAYDPSYAKLLRDAATYKVPQRTPYQQTGKGSQISWWPF